MHPLSEVVEIELTDDEWYMLNRGMSEWGHDWVATTGLGDLESFTTLRSLQAKLMPTIVFDVSREEEIGRGDPAAAEAELTCWPAGSGIMPA